MCVRGFRRLLRRVLRPRGARVLYARDDEESACDTATTAAGAKRTAAVRAHTLARDGPSNLVWDSFGELPGKWRYRERLRTKVPGEPTAAGRECQHFSERVSIHRDSVSDNSTAIMSVAPTCHVAEERDATDDEREDARRSGASHHGRAAQRRPGRSRPQPLRAAGLSRARRRQGAGAHRAGSRQPRARAVEQG